MENPPEQRSSYSSKTYCVDYALSQRILDCFEPELLQNLTLWGAHIHEVMQGAIAAHVDSDNEKFEMMMLKLSAKLLAGAICFSQALNRVAQHIPPCETSSNESQFGG